MAAETARKSGVLEALTLFAAGAVCVQLSRGGSAAARLHAQAGNPALYQLLFIYGAVFLLLALSSWLLGRSGQSLGGLLLDQWRAERQRPAFGGAVIRSFAVGRFEMLWLILILGVGFGVRVHFMAQPMRYDESITFLNFVSGQFHKLFLYPKPNNHVFNSLLQKFTCWALGPDPAAIRLPAFLAGVVLMPLSWALCRRLSPSRCAGLLASFGAALLPYLVLYSTNGRGYTLLALLIAALVFVTLAEEGRSADGRWLLAALLSALAMFVMPSALYALAGWLAWSAGVVFLQMRSARQALLGLALPYAAATALLTLLLYTPVILVSGGFAGLTSNRFVQALPLAAFAAGVMPHVLETLHDMSRDVPSIVSLALGILALGGTWAGLRSRNHALALLLPGFLFGAMAVFVLKRSIPFARTWICLIPVVLASADAALAALLDRLGGAWRKLLLAVAAIAGLWFAACMVSRDSIAQYPDTGTFPEATVVVQYLAPLVSANDTVCAEQPADGTVAYYLWRDVKPAEYLGRMRPPRKKYFIELNAPTATDSDMGAAVVLLRRDSFTVFDWSALAEPPAPVKKSTCWSPAAQAGL